MKTQEKDLEVTATAASSSSSISSYEDSNEGSTFEVDRSTLDFIILLGDAGGVVLTSVREGTESDQKQPSERE